MKKFLVGLVLLLLLLEIYRPVAFADGVVASVKTDRSVYASGETVSIAFTLTNPGNAPVKYTFNNAKIYDFKILSGGRTVYQWSYKRSFADVITYLDIITGATKTFLEKWDTKDNTGKLVSDGTYELMFFLALPNAETEVSTSTTFVIGKASEPPVFKDVSDLIINKYLKTLVDKKLVKGYPDQTFRPANNLTRAEALVLIMRVLDINPSTYSNSSFEDVAKNFWALNDIEEGVNKGIIRGVSATKFAPNAYITSGEFTVMLVRAVKLDLSATQSPFEDVKETYFGYKEIIAAYNASIVTGTSVGGKLYFYPNKPITRGEAIIELGKATEK